MRIQIISLLCFGLIAFPVFPQERLTETQLFTLSYNAFSNTVSASESACMQVATNLSDHISFKTIDLSSVLVEQYVEAKSAMIQRDVGNMWDFTGSGVRGGLLAGSVWFRCGFSRYFDTQDIGWQNAKRDHGLSLVNGKFVGYQLVGFSKTYLKMSIRYLLFVPDDLVSKTRSGQKVSLSFKLTGATITSQAMNFVGILKTIDPESK